MKDLRKLGITDRDLRDAVAERLAGGEWSAEKGGSCHIKMRHRSGASITCSCTPRDPRGRLNLLAAFRRAERGAK
jgi:hypothetical protein